MTTQQQPALFDWATELSDAQGHVTLSEQEAHEIGARLRSMGEKLKAYEDLDGAASDVQLLRMGYAAARLEIESLQARIKTMAEEHADELMVAHLDGRAQAAQQPAPSAAVALSDDLRDRLVAISEAVADQDDRAAQAMLREILKAPQPTPTPQAGSQPAPVLDMAVMQLAESVGLIGPASRTHDLHAAVQRFHDLICVNATIKAAVMAADAIRGAATSARDYPPLPMQFACSGVFPVYSADQMRAYVDADRAARAPADSVLEDAARLDWLDENIFHREMGNWDARYGHGDGYNMWVLFAPKGAQGSARSIIDAAKAAQEGKSHGN